MLQDLGLQTFHLYPVLWAFAAEGSQMFSDLISIGVPDADENLSKPKTPTLQSSMGLLKLSPGMGRRRGAPHGG